VWNIKKLKLDKLDVLFITGSIFLVTGIALHSISNALIILGAVLLFTPVMEIVGSVIRGLRS
jgi:hypothetical protein